MSEARKSLYARYPKRWWLPAMVVAALAILVAGQTLPFMEIEKLVFLTSGYSLPQSIWSMWTGGDYLLAVVIFVFSILFPFSKLILLLYIWFVPFTAGTRRRTLFWLEFLGKWSMLDVFVVAVLLVLIKGSSMVSATPRIGLFFSPARSCFR